MHSKADMPVVLARLQTSLASNAMFFGFGANQDFGDSTRQIAFATGGGLGLPDRDNYFKTDEKSAAIRTAYVAYMGATFERLGESKDVAAQHAAQVMALETALAQATLTRVEKRDPHKQFNVVDAAGLQALTPGFDWQAYLRTAGVKNAKTFNVTEPAFFKALAKEWQEKDLAVLQAYLRWHVARQMSPSLSSDFDQAHFDFYSKTLRGVKEQRPRWKRCVALVDRQLGEALGQEFVRRNFGKALREKALHMTVQVEQAMKADIDSLDWMSAETKARAQEKLAAVANKIGYPDKWRDYSSYKVSAHDFAGNVARGNLFEVRRELNKIGKPIDRKEWGMTPPTVNAYYNPQMNDINFPAGVLQPPLYDPKLDDAPNYGNTGGSIGHELVHAFDDEGRKFDAKGNLTDWWTKEDADKFAERSQCIVDQYSGYTIVDDIKINGKLTLGEDTADLGGLILAYVAWKAEMAAMPQQAQPLREGFTPEQRFFIGYAQWACENNRPEDERQQALTNPHSPGRYRVNGPLVNMPEFQQAFSCKAGTPMVPAKRCRVW
jgi:putative endopeptidase